MVLETAQLLSNALLHKTGQSPYKKTHWNHPCSVWVRESTGNYNWLVSLFKYLCEEYKRRYNREHKCSTLIPLFNLHCPTTETWQDRTPFKNCTDFKDLPTFEAYRRTMRRKWTNDKTKPSWKIKKT
jgi:hypothetical protein